MHRTSAEWPEIDARSPYMFLFKSTKNEKKIFKLDFLLGLKIVVFSIVFMKCRVLQKYNGFSRRG